MAVTSRVELGASGVRPPLVARGVRAPGRRRARRTSDDLERLAIAAHLVGEDDDSAAAWERAHLACLDAGDRERAARCAFWLGLALAAPRRDGRAAPAGWRGPSGWSRRPGRRCAARGYLLVPGFLESARGGRRGRGAPCSPSEIVDIAARCADRDLLALGLLCRGQASARARRGRGGLRLLDEAMVSVTTGEVSPDPRRHRLLRGDRGLRRRASTCGAPPSGPTRCPRGARPSPTSCPTAGNAWCTGRRCFRRTGTGRRRSPRRSGPASASPIPATLRSGIARYQQGELHRLRGEFAEADAGLPGGGELGRDPAPGFALLRLARATSTAPSSPSGACSPRAAIARVRPAVLAAAVEIYLAAGDVAAARPASDELADARRRASTHRLLHAIADGAAGSVLLAEGDAGAALDRAAPGAAPVALARDALRDAAGPACGIATACRALGDDDAAELELEAARATFERLGARPDLRRLAELARRSHGIPTGC